MESKNSGERASGVRNHTRLCLGLFVRRNSGTSSSTFLPFNSARIYRIGLGEQISALSNDGVAGTLNVTELT